MRTSLLSLLALMAIAVAFPGCKSLNMNKMKGDKGIGLPRAVEPVTKKEEVKFGTPTQMAVIWKDSTYSQPGATPARGFGGRVYFYDEDNKPIRVQGELIVYGFDDSNRRSEQQAPSADRKYIFRNHELQRHFGETELGPSYSVWVPWDKVGGFRKTIALLPVFKNSDGGLVRSSHTINVLPGKDDPNANIVDTNFRTAQSATLGNSAQFANAQVGHEEAAATGERRTTTIRVPRGMADRINRGGAKIGQPAKSTPTLSKRESPAAADGDPSPESNAASTPAATAPANRFDATASTNRREPRKRPVFGQPGAYK